MAIPGLSSITRALNMPAFTKTASKAPEAPPPKLSVSEQAAKDAKDLKKKRVGDDVGASVLVAGMFGTAVMGTVSQLSQQAVNAGNAKHLAETNEAKGYLDAIKAMSS